VTALALETRTDQDPVLLPVPAPREPLPAESLPPESLSLSQLVACYDGMVRAIARRYRLQDSDVDDVAQTTWLRLVQSLDRIQDRACVPGWLATTTRRESMRVLRQRQREVTVDLEAGPDVADEDAADPLLGLLDDEMAAALHDALDELPPRWRDLLWALACSDGAGYAWVAESTGIPIGSIGPTRQRALAQLRAVLTARGLHR
jgi:RNA polymerase sigma factor (sigma-70 family)